jgi:iron(II)-dependent oxidoreductase
MSCLLLAGVAAAPALAQEKSPALPSEVVINGVEFVLVPEGWFWYSVETRRPYELALGEPLHRDVRVWLDSYYIGKYPARARDLERFLNTGKVRHIDEYGGRVDGCAVREDDKGRFYQIDTTRDLPATQLSWNLADEFARWMGFRLPSEAEWEKAARGSDKRHWPWGNDFPDDTYAGFLNNPFCNPTPVDAFPKGVSPYGAYNMAGNVWEFVADWFNADFDQGLKDGVRNPPLAKDGTIHTDVWMPVKILKGGRWASDPSGITIHARNFNEPQEYFRCFGTRFAVDVATVRKHLAAGSATIAKR